MGTLDPLRTGVRSRPAGPLRVLRVLLFAVALPWLILGAGEADYRGRLLVDVLREAREAGLNLVFSSAAVPPDLRIPANPQQGTTREMLEEILDSLGLRLQEGPQGSLLVLTSLPATGTIGGTVLDGTGSPVSGATLRIRPGAFTATSADDGSFLVSELPAGIYRLAATARGYSGASVSRIRIVGDDTVAVEVTLQPYAFVTEVVVTPGRHSVVSQEQSTGHRLTGDQAVLMPTIGDDVTRMVELLPGVTANNSSAAFNVRGSTVTDVSLVLDGLELYDPYHLQSFQSPFSVIDSNVVDRIDFFGGGFTVDRGDRHGAFVDISTVAPAIAGRGELELGTLNSRLSYQAPLGDGGGAWLVSARGWYPEAVLDATELGGGEDLDPRFGDVYLKAGFAAGSRHVLSAHGLFSYDRLKFQETGEEINESVDALTRNAYGWVRATSLWSAAWSGETIFSGGRIERIRDGIAAEDEPIVVDDDRVVHFYGLRHDATAEFSARHALKLGIDVRRLGARYRYSNVVGDEDAESFDLDPDGTSLAAYAAHRARLSDSMAVEWGLRWDRQTYTNDNQLSPRFNATWTPSDRTELRLAMGRYNQSQRIHELRVEDGETEFSAAEASEQAELSFRRVLADGLRVRIDAYYRKLSELRPRYENLFEPIELFPETTADRILIAPDEARLRGIELLLQGPTGNSFHWWASYTLSSAEDRIDGSFVPRSWDQRHAGKFLLGYQRRNHWSVSLSGSAHTGWPTTMVLAEESEDEPGEYEAVPDERNADRFAHYARLDLKARRSFELAGSRLWLTLEVLNLTDRDNPCCLDDVFFIEQDDGSVEASRLFDNWLGITPSFSVQWEF